ncbi:hypothetical protein AX774_g2589 [Zancudomyces culisetae]|uniref:Uncharacterized protein n=1 Tax=Zancudomyces culisetae TaxID=1213189 RepID=A0A1R1PSH1_ZANCU|nr:hypothetical protein AX774_g2589 [Zancudomyces culisetae]|eukprot:OMH83891.1 hypothetical protein AX774_g2589 [Zancudomyces culisetae]
MSIFALNGSVCRKTTSSPIYDQITTKFSGGEDSGIMNNIDNVLSADSVDARSGFFAIKKQADNSIPNVVGRKRKVRHRSEDYREDLLVNEGGSLVKFTDFEKAFGKVNAKGVGSVFISEGNAGQLAAFKGSADSENFTFSEGLFNDEYVKKSDKRNRKDNDGKGSCKDELKNKNRELSVKVNIFSDPGKTRGHSCMAKVGLKPRKEVPQAWCKYKDEWFSILGSETFGLSAGKQRRLFVQNLKGFFEYLRSNLGFSATESICVEFPSLELTLHESDDECSILTLKKLFKYHRSVEKYRNSPTIRPGEFFLKRMPDAWDFRFVIRTTPCPSSVLAHLETTTGSDVVEPVNNSTSISLFSRPLSTRNMHSGKVASINGAVCSPASVGLIDLDDDLVSYEDDLSDFTCSDLVTDSLGSGGLKRLKC